MQSRWRSKAAWVSVFAVIAFLLGNYGLYDYIGLTPETFQKLVDLVLSACVVWGIFNNPTDKENY
jgi:uncharacterized membrane protein